MTHPSETTHPAMGIREFARYYGYSEAEVRRAMRHLSIRGTSQGRGRPTLLSPTEQGALLEQIEGPDERLAMQATSALPAESVPTEATQIQPAPVQNLPIQDMPELEPALEVREEPVREMPLITEPMPPAPVVGLSGELPGALSHPDAALQHRDLHRDLQISQGNHRTVLEAPSIPQSYDLAQFRSAESIQAIADPGEVANQAMAAIDALVSGMDSDIRQQRQQLEQTQEAAQALRLKAKHLQDKKLEYMIQSTAIGQSQQRYTSELQEALGEVQALGKSPRSEQEPPSP